MTLTLGSLFSGIGGLELGLERAGMRTVWQVEQSAFCRAVLAKHWPDVPKHEDVRNVGRSNLASVDVICGGFPCQDISVAGKGAGLAGERSGLWSEYARIVRELRPRYVLIENVAALLHRGLDIILGDLAGIGYDAEWSVVSACSVGAPHVRRRLFVVAYTNGLDGREGIWNSAPQGFGQVQALDGFARKSSSWRARVANPSTLYRGADGVPDRMERNHAIGNSVVPQVAEVIGRLIVEADARYEMEGAA